MEVPADSNVTPIRGAGPVEEKYLLLAAGMMHQQGRLFEPVADKADPIGGLIEQSKPSNQQRYNDYTGQLPSNRIRKELEDRPKGRPLTGEEEDQYFGYKKRLTDTKERRA